jgi:hypothetical protein
MRLNQNLETPNHSLQRTAPGRHAGCLRSRRAVPTTSLSLFRQATTHTLEMNVDKPFQKSFACAGFLFAVILVILIATGAQNLSYRIGYVFSTCLFPALAAGTWGFFSKKHWSWGRFAATVIGFYLVFGLIMISGKAQR